MRARVWLAGVLALAGLSAGTSIARADSDTFRLAMPANPQAGAPTVNLALTPEKDADTVDVRGWHGGWHGGWRGGWGGWRGGWGWGRGGWGYGARFYGGWGGWGRPYYYRSWAYYPRYYGGYGWGGYGWGGYYGIYSYPSYYYSFPYYYNYGYNPYCYWIGNTTTQTPVVSLSINPGRVAIQSQALSSANPYLTPNTIPNPYATNPYAGPANTLPNTPRTVEEPTYPYDGGPRSPVPLPQTTPQQPTPAQPMNTPPTLPLEGRSVSLPVQKTQWAYPAYGEAPRVTNFAQDRQANTYLTSTRPAK
jgi:hypothetical protein